MPTPILMPALSPTMEQGKLAKWLVKEGDTVQSGDAIAEIETDKATMEVEAVDEGTIGKIMISEGTEGVAVNTPIAMLLTEGEDASALAAVKAPSQATPKKDVQPAQAKQASAPMAKGEGQARVEHAPEKANGNGRILASPLARRLAKQSGIDLSLIKGSGPHGRIIKHDVDDAAKSGLAEAAAPLGTAPQPVPAPNGGALVPARPIPSPMTDEQILALYEKGSYEVLPLDNMRKTIALRLTAAKATIPHYRLTVECRLDALLKARQQLNVRSPKDGPNAYKLSVNDFLIKAMGLALQRIPHANATFTERGILLHKHSDVGVAVAVDGGLFTPIIREVEHKTLAQISNEMKELAERARRRRLAPHEYQGGTTAISNLGMYGIDQFDAVINPPHATILAVGQAEQRPVVTAGQLGVATMMTCTLSCDHRVVDGALGAKLLTAFKSFVEEPVTMLV
jgi:pyruvate dehydrogenase E2 component (dihydrolipoamide acetyltransferase)